MYMKEFQLFQTFTFRPSRFQYYLLKWLPTALLMGVSVGMVMSVFVFLVQWGQEVIDPALAPLTIIIAGLITAVMSKRGYSEVEGAGIGYLIEKKNKREPIHPRTILTRFVASTTSIGGRIPGGQEGPAILIGGALGYFLGKNLLKMKKQDLSLVITVAAAASTSAVFQAPLGGTLFAAEVPYKQDLDTDVYMPAFTASIVSVITVEVIRRFILPIKSFSINFGTQPLPFTIEWILITALLGAVIGIFSHVYCHAFVYLSSRITTKIQRWQAIIVSSVIAAVIVALASRFTNAPIAETGFQLLEFLAENEEALTLSNTVILFLIKMIVILICIGGGNAVGIFGPSLVLGALIGSMFAIFTGQTSYVGDFFVIGMASMHTGTSKTPISAMILVLELSGLPHLILHMTVANVVAYMFSGNVSLYPGQLKNKIEGIKQMLEPQDLLAAIPVAAVMSTKIHHLEPQMTVGEAKKHFREKKKHTMPVIDGDTKILVGIISLQDLERVNDDKNIENVMIRNVITVRPQESLRDALVRIVEHDVERFPVVDDEMHVIGFITLHDIILAYRKQRRAEIPLSI